MMTLVTILVLVLNYLYSCSDYVMMGSLGCQIYVEIERARLTRTLAKLKEEQGAVTEAANILQELQVETFGSMDKKEKVEFILEQMRLCLAKKDFVRTQIISKKISTKYFANESTQVREFRSLIFVFYYFHPF